MKFSEGGWATLARDRASSSFAAFAIKRHYNGVRTQLKRLDAIVEAAESESRVVPGRCRPRADPKARTAVILVNGFNGLGLHTILNVPRMFGNTFQNFVFVQVGSVDAGNFKGAADIEDLRAHTEAEAQRYVQFARARGYGSKAFTVDRLRRHERGDEARAGGRRPSSRTRSSSPASCSSPTRRT